jgi:hypothetical protein
MRQRSGRVQGGGSAAAGRRGAAAQRPGAGGRQRSGRAQGGGSAAAGRPCSRIRVLGDPPAQPLTPHPPDPLPGRRACRAPATALHCACSHPQPAILCPLRPQLSSAPPVAAAPSTPACGRSRAAASARRCRANWATSPPAASSAGSLASRLQRRGRGLQAGWERKGLGGRKGGAGSVRRAASERGWQCVYDVSAVAAGALVPGIGRGQGSWRWGSWASQPGVGASASVDALSWAGRLGGAQGLG